MSAPIPQWALAQAREHLNAELAHVGSPDRYLAHEAEHNINVIVLARYIAAHEEPPVDPLLIEARDMVARIHHDRWTESPWHITEAEELRAGRRDYTLVMGAALEGIKHGLALAARRGEQ